MTEEFPSGLQALESNGKNTMGPNENNFLDETFTGQRDYTVVQYSVTDSSLLGNSRIRYKGTSYCVFSVSDADR
jgi:hypothetical protein